MEGLWVLVGVIVGVPTTTLITGWTASGRKPSNSGLLLVVNWKAPKPPGTSTPAAGAKLLSP
jgi:hypothetical protein